jgi:release factor glutamine methyltransferase
VLEGDLLAPVPGELDVVAANLPYLPYADRALYPDLAGEPPAAVFAEGDGLDPYRRLLTQAELRLRPDGAVIFQLHREVFVAERNELAAMRARLDALTPALAA